MTLEPIERVLSRELNIDLSRENLIQAAKDISTVHPESAALPDEVASLYDSMGDVEDRNSYTEVMARSLVTYSKLLANSISTEQCSEMLSVKPSRVRQKIRDGTIWAIKDGNGWKIPSIQFYKGRQVVGLDKVFPSLSSDHPLSVYGLLTTHQLDFDNMNMVDWLITTGDVGPALDAVERHKWSAA